MPKIVFVGGGTGGHIMPLIALANEIDSRFKNASKKIEILFITSGKQEIINILKQNKTNYKLIQAGKLRRYFSFQNFIDIPRIIIGFFQSLWILTKIKPRVIFSKGGYVSFPPVLAGWILRIPIIIHESDLTPGLANRILSRLANRIAISFEGSKKYFSPRKVVLTGNPIRQELLKGDKECSQKIFNLRKDLPTILVIGGSQGAKRLNEIILQILPKLIRLCQIIHISGPNNFKETKEKFEKAKIVNAVNYHLYPYLGEQMKDAYAAADLVISRAGANALNEILTLGKASILIPLSTAASDHQAKNAYYLSKQNATIIFEEKNINLDNLTEKILSLLKNPPERKKIETKARSLAMPDTSARICKEILKFI